MVNLYVSPFLWFLAGWQGGALLVGLLGLPAVVGFIPGIVMGIAVAWDARRAAHEQAAVRWRIQPINEVAARLDGQGDQWPSTKAPSRRA